MWLQTEARGKAALLWTFATVKINLVYSFVALWVLSHTGVVVPATPISVMLVAGGLSALFLSSKLVLFEELLYRFPLIFFTWLQYSLGSLLMFAVIFSVFFGLAHGSPEHILVEGVHGMMYSLLFLKCGGLQGRPFKALACTFTAHFAYNASLFVFAALF